MRRRLRWGGLGLAVLLLAVAVWFSFAPPAAPGEDSAEAGFARDMRTHHAQAVEMSMYLYRNGSDPALRELAYDIALTQQAQIGMMTGWLDEWGLKPTSTKPPMSWMDHRVPMPSGRMPGMASPQELEELYSAEGSRADALYCELMVTHHEYGIHMAEAIGQRTVLPRVADLAEAMVEGQDGEIRALEEYGAAAAKDG